MRIFIQSLFLFLIASASKLSYASEWSGSAGLEFRGFNQTAKDTQQDFIFEDLREADVDGGGEGNLPGIERAFSILPSVVAPLLAPGSLRIFGELS